MAGGASNYVRLSETDRDPNAPQLQLVVESDERLSTTLPFQLRFCIKRAHDGHKRPCIFHWSPVIHGFSKEGLGFVLLHHQADGQMNEVQFDHHAGRVKLPEEKELVVNGWNHHLWELAPGDEVKFVSLLLSQYHKAVQAGETYELLWPGSEILQWEWGTIKEHMNQELKPRSSEETPEKPRLILPGGPSIIRKVEAEVDPWPARAEVESKHGFYTANREEQRWRLQQAKKKQPPASPPPIDASERETGAPILRVALECSPTITCGQIFDVTTKVTYDVENVDEKSLARPIIFHTHAFEAAEGPREGYRLYHQQTYDNNLVWESYEDPDATPGWMIYDDPDVSVHPTQHKDFVSLAPGETWTTQRRLQGGLWTEFPRGYVAGDVFRYKFKGGVVDWWDWGSGEEHVDTVVKLPCYIAGEVTDPTDNGGRPKLVVPASATMQIRVVE